MFKKCRCRRFDSCKSEKSSLRTDQEREGDCYLSQETVRRIELTSQWFHFWSHPMLLLPSTTHLQFRPNQLLKRETERPFEGIMIDHEQLNPLVRWRSLTLLSPHREWKAKVFYTKGEFCAFFYLHRDMQVIPDTEARIVLSLFKKKITRWCSWMIWFALPRGSVKITWHL